MPNTCTCYRHCYDMPTKDQTLLFLFMSDVMEVEKERREGELKIKLLPMKLFLVLKRSSYALLFKVVYYTEEKRVCWPILVTSFYVSANQLSYYLRGYANYMYANLLLQWLVYGLSVFQYFGNYFIFGGVLAWGQRNNKLLSVVKLLTMFCRQVNVFWFYQQMILYHDRN